MQDVVGNLVFDFDRNWVTVELNITEKVNQKIWKWSKWLIHKTETDQTAYENQLWAIFRAIIFPQRQLFQLRSWLMDAVKPLATIWVKFCKYQLISLPLVQLHIIFCQD